MVTPQLAVKTQRRIRAFLTSALDRVAGQGHYPATLPREKLRDIL